MKIKVIPHEFTKPIFNEIWAVIAQEDVDLNALLQSFYRLILKMDDGDLNNRVVAMFDVVEKLKWDLSATETVEMQKLAGLHNIENHAFSLGAFVGLTKKGRGSFYTSDLVKAATSALGNDGSFNVTSFRFAAFSSIANRLIKPLLDYKCENEDPEEAMQVSRLLWEKWLRRLRKDVKENESMNLFHFLIEKRMQVEPKTSSEAYANATDFKLDELSYH